MKKIKNNEQTINHKDWYNNNISNLSQNVWLPEQNKDVINYNHKISYNENKNIFYSKFNQQKQTYDIQKLNIDKYKSEANEVIKSLRIKLVFDDQQTQIIKNQFDEAKKIYNICVELYNKTKDNDKDLFSNSREHLRNRVFRYAYQNIYIYDDYLKTSKTKYSGKKIVPSQFCYDILDDEIRAFCSNLKSCRSNKKAGNIKHFTITNKDCSKFQSVFIKNNCLSSKGIYINSFNKQPINQKIINKTIKNFIKREENINNIHIKDRKDINESSPYLDKYKADSRLCYDKINEIFYLQMPLTFVSKNNHVHESKVVAIDPGIKIPFCLFSEDHYGDIGNNMKDKLMSYYKGISKYQSILEKNMNKNGKKIKHKKYLKKRINKYYKKIRNIVKEFHNKTALFLCKNYETIMLPKFGTKSMVENKISPLSKENKNILNALSFYKFRQHLQKKATEYGCRLLIVLEHYTSMTCTKYGHQSKNYINREKQCKNCNYKINRDINGSRNILLKNMNLISCVR